MEFKGGNNTAKKGSNSLHGGQEDNTGQSWDMLPRGAHQMSSLGKETNIQQTGQLVCFVSTRTFNGKDTNPQNISLVRFLGPEMVKNLRRRQGGGKDR